MNKSVYSYNCVIFLWKLCCSSRSHFDTWLQTTTWVFRRDRLVALSEAAEVYGSSKCKGTRHSGTNMGLLVRAPLQSSLRGDGARHTKPFLHARPFDHEPKPCPIVRVSHTPSLGCLEILGRCSCSARRSLRSSVRHGCGAVFDTSSRDSR